MNGRAEVHRLQTRLDAAFARAQAANVDLESKADYAKYMCVLVSGFLESAIVALLLQFVQERSSPQVLSFAERELKHWTNPNVEKILTLFGAFDSDWRREIESFLSDERKDSLNSLVAIRHKIVHGDSVGTTLSQALRHHKHVVDLVKFLEELTAK